MAFTGRTPESLIPRSDSRNPATTCKGITKAGRPCRRPIDAKASQGDGVIVVASIISESDDEETGLAAYFCWQHKDQAELLAAQTTGTETQLYPLNERASIDTLIERLGVLDVEDATIPTQQNRKSSKQDRRTDGPQPHRKVHRPPTWAKVEGPLISIPSDVMADRRRRPQRLPKPAPRRKKPSFWATICCGAADDDDDDITRYKQRATQRPGVSQYDTNKPMQQVSQPPVRLSQSHNRRTSVGSTRPPLAPRVSSEPPKRKPLGDKPARPVNKVTREDSETTQLLKYIPPTLSPQLTSILLAELSKPISPHDDEGYIYIFWLTPEAAGPAPSSAASTLLTPPSRPEQNRRTSDVLRQYSVSRSPRARPDTSRRRSSTAAADPSNDTILLKIGRANNVHRRMHEWTRQCGYSLSLVRYYPYVPSTPSPTPSPQASPANPRRPSSQSRPADPRRRVSEGVRKVPHAHRVERLVHLELGEQRVVKKCEACGKEHREWFEVEASKEGVKRVDEVVRRWVGWAERANE
ncbi:hypothetical protein ACN47E_005225 [Coniothyrium glycines]